MYVVKRRSAAAVAELRPAARNFPIDQKLLTGRASIVFRPACNIERQLIQRVRNGEHEVFYVLIQPYERRVWGAGFAILRNEADAEDAAQDAVLKALKHIRQFRAEARFSTWLIQIAVNEARMRRRKKHAHVVEPILIGEDGEDNYRFCRLAGDPFRGP